MVNFLTTNFHFFEDAGNRFNGSIDYAAETFVVLLPPIIVALIILALLNGYGNYLKERQEGKSKREQSGND